MSRMGLAVVLLAGGCAVFNPQNTPVLNTVEAAVPSAGLGRVIGFPLLLPFGVAALSLDMVIVHPVSVADDAWRDALDALWRELDWDTEYVSSVTWIPMRTCFTPAVWAGSLLFRSCFDVGSDESGL